MVLGYLFRFKYWEGFFYISIILNKNALGATASVLYNSIFCTLSYWFRNYIYFNRQFKKIYFFSAFIQLAIEDIAYPSNDGDLFRCFE